MATIPAALWEVSPFTAEAAGGGEVEPHKGQSWDRDARLLGPRASHQSAQGGLGGGVRPSARKSEL